MSVGSMRRMRQRRLMVMQAERHSMSARKDVMSGEDDVREQAPPHDVQNLSNQASEVGQVETECPST